MNRLNNFFEIIKGYLKSIDIPLFIFLGMVTFSGLIVKLVGVLFIYIIRPNFNFKFFQSRLPLFYIAILIIPFFQIIIDFREVNEKHLLVMLFSAFLWLMSFLVIHQLKTAVENSGIQKVEKSIELFFIINIVFSIYLLIKIMFITHTLNPFMYSGMNYHYHVSTGDHINGIFRDVSTTNACISLFSMIYFFKKNKYHLAILSLVVVLITTSNIVNIILILILAFLALLSRSKIERLVATGMIGIVTLFLVKVSPNNLRYLTEKFNINELFNDLPTENAEMVVLASDEEAPEDESNLSSDEKRDNEIFAKIYNETIIYQQEKKNRDIQLDSTFVKKQSSEREHNLLFSKRVYGDSLTECTDNYNLMYNPGKVISFAQTFEAITKSPKVFLLGNGMGNFSSKAAFKASGFRIFGNYPQRYEYISKVFKDNHLKILTYYFIQSRDKHSVINTPFSVYNQILGEYGVLGLLFFLLFYIGYFLKKFTFLSYGKFLLPITLFFFLTEYWFENLSVVIVFELLIFLDIANNEQKNLIGKNFIDVEKS